MRKINTIYTSVIIWIGFVLISFNSNINVGLSDFILQDDSYFTFLLGLCIMLFPIIHNYAEEESHLLIDDHNSRFLYRAMTAIAISIVFLGISNMHKTLSLTLFIGFYFWITFDICYNLFKARSILYLGKKATLDRLFRFSPLFGFIVKILLFISSIYLFLKL